MPAPGLVINTLFLLDFPIFLYRSFLQAPLQNRMMYTDVHCHLYDITESRIFVSWAEIHGSAVESQNLFGSYHVLFKLSWQKSTEKQAAAYEELLKRRSSVEKQGKRSTLNAEDEENENEDSFLERERMSLVVPSYHSFADIEQLVPAAVYLVEVSIHHSSRRRNFEFELLLLILALEDLFSDTARNFLRAPPANFKGERTFLATLAKNDGVFSPSWYDFLKLHKIAH